MLKGIRVVGGCFFMLLLGAQSLLAQRAFVSAKTGNDANPCTLASPCRSFGQALSSVAAGGEIVVLDSGGYGPVAIGKAVSIVTPPGIYAGISVSSSAPGISINASASDVVSLRGVTLVGFAGAVDGIDATVAALVSIENCVISGFSSSGVNAAAPVVVRDSVLRGNGFNGIGVSGTATVERCLLEKNNSGLEIFAGANVFARDVNASFNVNGLIAVELTTATAQLSVENCTVTNNTVGLQASADTGSAIVKVSDTSITGNGTGIAVSGTGASVLSRQNNTLENNTSTDGAFSGPFSAK